VAGRLAALPLRARSSIALFTKSMVAIAKHADGIGSVVDDRAVAELVNFDG
jgi:hypothetical protein